MFANFEFGTPDPASALRPQFLTLGWHWISILSVCFGPVVKDGQDCPSYLDFVPEACPVMARLIHHAGPLAGC